MAWLVWVVAFHRPLEGHPIFLTEQFRRFISRFSRHKPLCTGQFKSSAGSLLIKKNLRLIVGKLREFGIYKQFSYSNR